MVDSAVVAGAVEECGCTAEKPSKRIRAVSHLLTAICALVAAGIALNCAGYLQSLANMVGMGEVAPLQTSYLINVGLSLVLDVMGFVSFILFSHAIVRHRTFFSTRQSGRLLVVALCLLGQVVLGATLPAISLPPLGTGAEPLVVQPILDIRLLSFSLVFFALAGIFEYGRMLQEESDSFV